MPRRRKDEIDPLVALLAIIVLGAAFFYLYAIPAIESWWAIYGIWVEVGLVFVAAGGRGHVLTTEGRATRLVDCNP